MFFNSSAGGYELNWARDYSGYAKEVKRKAPQIEISLTFTLPTTFSLGEPVVWRRVWRKTGFHEEEIKLHSGRELPPRSKADSYLKTLRYEYVPAIKGNEYFEKLLGHVHDMLDITVHNDIRTAAANFTESIQSHTKGILADLEDQLGLKSDLELPSDLRRLFSDLEFRSTVGSHRVALAQRGDGIKVRHIPIILRWLATQANQLSASGRPRVETIWGYEEPENNLETRRCFELAEFFLQNVSSIQTFLTTHSPVFYSVFHSGNNDVVSLAEVKLEPTGTQVVPRVTGVQNEIMALHSSIGFLDLIEPHVHEWRQRVDQLKTRLEESFSTDHPTIFVEGPSDKQIIEAILKKYFSSASQVRVLCSTRNGGGHAWVKDSLIAWHHQRPKARAVGLFDGDDASKPSIKEFQEVIEKRGSTKAIKYAIKPAGAVLEAVKVGIRIQPAIEELCPDHSWKKAEEKGWLCERSDLPRLYDFRETAITFNDWLILKLPDLHLRLIACKRVGDKYKHEFSAFVAELISKSECQSEFKPLKDLVGELINRLDLETTGSA